ncbi:MAG: FkbM family methyltransferase [Bacteroidota bacterium]
MRNIYWKLGRKLYLKGRKDDIRGTVDDSEKKLIRDLVPFFNKKDKVVLFDIGANIGDWSLYNQSLLKNKGEQLRQYLFEPIPKTYSKLLTNISGNNVTIENMAISNETGEVTMFIAREDFAGTNSLYNTNIKDAQEVKVKTTTLQDYLVKNNIQHIDFAKCDAEGHDFKIIAGAKQLFESEKISFFQFEYNHRWIYARSYLKDVYDVLEDTPYYVAKITKDGLEVYQEWHFELEKYFQSNFLIIHKPQLSALKDVRLGNIGSGNVFLKKL